MKKKPDIGTRFYLPTWREHPEPNAPKATFSSLRVLIFMDSQGLGKTLAHSIRREGGQVIGVKYAKEFKHQNKDCYHINASSAEEYIRLLNTLAEKDFKPNRIIHLWNITPLSTNKLIKSSGSMVRSFYSLFYLTQAIGSHKLTEPLRLIMISNNMQYVCKTDDVEPCKSLLLGPCKTIPKEFPNISCCSIDIEIKTPNFNNNPRLINNILVDIIKQRCAPVVALRNNKRLIPDIKSINFDTSEPPVHTLRNNGIYCIIGGFGEIGLKLAETLANRLKAKLILIGKSGLPLRSQWQDWLKNHPTNNRISNKILKVQALEKIGAEVLDINADLTNTDEMDKAIKLTCERFGTIHGVFQLAGVSEHESILSKTYHSTERILAPKVVGSITLDKALGNMDLDFVILFSSINTFIAQPGQIDQVAANAFVNTFAHYRNTRRPGSTVAINWDKWQSAETVGKQAEEINCNWDKQNKLTNHNSNIAKIKNEIQPKEGIQALWEIINHSNYSQVIVTSQDPNFIIKHDNSWSERINVDSKETIKTNWFKSSSSSQGEATPINLSLKNSKDLISTSNNEDSAVVKTTVEKIFSAYLLSRGSKNDPWPILLPIQPNGTRPPFFCVHGRGGNALNYLTIARRLSADQPFYALQSKGLDGKEEPYHDLKSMAGYYISKIRTIQPHGPYYLGGGSMGGMVAFEIAQQLRQDGDKIAFLVMFDTYGPHYFDYHKPSINQKNSRLYQQLTQVASQSLRGKISYLFTKCLGRLKLYSKEITCKIYRLLGWPLPHYLRYWYVEKSNVKALFKYMPKTYTGSFTMFKALVPDDEAYNDPELGWGRRTTNSIRYIGIPSSHSEIVEHPLLAKKFKICLEEAQMRYHNVKK